MQNNYRRRLITALFSAFKSGTHTLASRVLVSFAVFSVLLSGSIVATSPARAEIQAPAAGTYQYLDNPQLPAATDPAALVEPEANAEIAEPPPHLRTLVSPAITVDIHADWDVSAPAVSPPGAQLLAYFVVNANDIEQGNAGYYNFTVVLEGYHAGFATYTRGTTTNAGHTLTVPFNSFPLATSERFGFSLIGNQQGDMGATLRVLNSAGVEQARAQLTPRPVERYEKLWDLVLSQTGWATGVIQEQTVAPAFNLTIHRKSPIPEGNIVFYFGFQDVNNPGGGHESARVPAVTRFHPSQWAGGAFPADRFELPLGPVNDAFVVGGGTPVAAYVTWVGSGWRFELPMDGFNAFADIPRNGGGEVIDPDMRVFGTIQIHFNSGRIATQFQNSIYFAGQAWGATWGGTPETDTGTLHPDVGGQPTFNNRVVWTFAPGGNFSSSWAPGSPVDGIQGLLWGIWGSAGIWDQTPSLQNFSAVYTAVWSAADYLPYGSEVVSNMITTGSGWVANCMAVNPAVTPFQGRILAHESRSEGNVDNIRLWYTNAPVGNLVGVDCYALGGWQEVPRAGVMSGQAAFILPNPSATTAIRAIGQVNMHVNAMNYTRMASPSEAGWLTARGWWPRSNNIDDFDHGQATGNSSHVHAATPGQLFASTNGTRDVIFGNYGFPRVTKAASNTSPGLGETVTFTIRAANISNFGSMEMTVFDQMDTRLQFVPGSVRVNDNPFTNYNISGPMPGSHVPGSTVRQLQFNLGLRPVNQIQTITFDAVARWDIGTVINTAWMVPDARAQVFHPNMGAIGTHNGTLSQVGLSRQLTGNMVLTKDVARSHMGPDTGEPELAVAALNAWKLSMLNGTNSPALSVIIDIFPFYGDGRGTTSNVTHQVVGFEAGHPVTVYYTVADPATVDPDPHAESNADRGQAGSIWRNWNEFAAGQSRFWQSNARPTAMMLVTATPIAVGARANFEIPFTALTFYGEQGTFVNYAWQRDNANHLRLVRAAVTVSEFPEIAVSKTLDGPQSGFVAPETPQTVIFELTNTGTEPLTNITLVDTTLEGPEVYDIQFAGWQINADGYLAYAGTGALLVLAPGQSITAHGTLPGMEAREIHENLVLVTGVGLFTGDPVRDEDPLRVEAVEPGISLEKFIAGAPVNDLGHPILLADRTTGLIPAQEITFRITNTGSDPLVNLVFTDVTLALPSLTSVAFPDVPGALVSGGGEEWVVEFPDFTLYPGQVIYGFGQLPPLHGSDLKHHNVATIVAEGEVTEETVTDDDELIIDPADLEVTKTVTADDGEFRAGGDVTWVITVTNHGPDRALNVDVTDQLANSHQATITAAQFTDLPADRAHSIEFDPAGVRAWVEYLNNGETLSITVNGTLSRGLRLWEVVTNTAIVESDTLDPDPLNNTDTAELIVERIVVHPIAELSLTGVGFGAAAVAALLLAMGITAMFMKKGELVHNN